MYYLGELARKPYARQEVLGLNPAGCKKNFSIMDILTFCPGSATRDKSLLSRKPCPGSKTGTKASLEPGQKTESVVVTVSMQLHTNARVRTRD